MCTLALNLSSSSASSREQAPSTTGHKLQLGWELQNLKSSSRIFLAKIRFSFQIAREKDDREFFCADLFFGTQLNRVWRRSTSWFSFATHRKVFVPAFVVATWQWPFSQDFFLLFMIFFWESLQNTNQSKRTDHLPYQTRLKADFDSKNIKIECQNTVCYETHITSSKSSPISCRTRIDLFRVRTTLALPQIWKNQPMSLNRLKALQQISQTHTQRPKSVPKGEE